MLTDFGRGFEIEKNVAEIELDVFAEVITATVKMEAGQRVGDYARARALLAEMDPADLPLLATAAEQMARVCRDVYRRTR